VYFGQLKRLTLHFSTTSAEQNAAIHVKGILTDNGELSFEWSSNWTVKETFSRARWLWKHPLELDGQENVFSIWTVNACRYRVLFSYHEGVHFFHKTL